MPTSSDHAAVVVGSGSPGLTAGERSPAPLHPVDDGHQPTGVARTPLQRPLAA